MLGDVAARAHMVPMLPCGDVGAMAEFWVSLGLEVTYRQQRPNPYLALGRGRIDLHYYGMPDWDPELSHSTCAIAVPDTEPLFEAFAAGLRARYGRLPMTGLPRITRPRRRANNAGLSGFSLVDPAGNWVRVTRAPGSGAEQVASTASGATPWTSGGGSPVARATENAVVMADSHGDVAQARSMLAGALRRAGIGAASSPAGSGVAAPEELAPALGYLVELCVRAGDEGAARAAFADLEELARAHGGVGAVQSALAAARTLLDDLPG